MVTFTWKYRLHKFEIGSEKCVVIPYFHGFSHLLRRIAAPLGINVIFSYNCKFETLPAAVNAEIEKCKELSTHVSVIDCKKCVVYSIPLPCGSEYVGQTGQCVNTWLTKHKFDVLKNKTLEFKRIVDHTVDCEICKEQGSRFYTYPYFV